MVSLIAEEAVRALGQSLPRVVEEPEDIDARSRVLYGAWLAGLSLGSVGMALHHKLCRVLGGTFGLPHAEVHTIVLPHAAAYNQPAASEALGRVAWALAADDAAGAPYDLAGRLKAKRALRDIGLRAANLDRAAALATQKPYYNPRPVASDAVRALLEEAFHERRP